MKISMPTPAEEKITLERVKLNASKFLGGDALENLRYAIWRDDIADQLVYGLQTYVMAERVRKEIHNVYFKYPANWWEHFKYQCIPARLRLKLGMGTKWITHRQAVVIEQLQAFPMFRQMMPKEDTQFEFAVLRGTTVEQMQPFTE